MIVQIKKAEDRDLFKAAMPRVLAACRNAQDRVLAYGP